MAQFSSLHKKMAEQYSMSGIGNQATKTHFHQHCEALIRSYQTEANEYDALAKAHQDMAAKGGSSNSGLPGRPARGV